MVRSGLVAVLCLGLCVVACRKRPELLPDTPPEPTTAVRDAGVAARAPATKSATGGPQNAPGQTLYQAKSSRDAEPDKAPQPAHGFAIPAGLRAVSVSAAGSSYELTGVSLAALERFYRRELGRDGTINKRAYGFEARVKDNNGFVLVTQRPGSDSIIIGVVPHMTPRRTSPELQEPGH